MSNKCRDSYCKPTAFEDKLFEDVSVQLAAVCVGYSHVYLKMYAEEVEEEKDFTRKHKYVYDLILKFIQIFCRQF